MKVLHLAQFIPPYVGGEERHVWNLAREMAARSHDVTLLGFATSDNPPGQSVTEGVRIVRVRSAASRLPFLYSDPSRPHASGIWSFEDLTATRQLKADLTPREREIAALLIEGLTSKLIGRRLGVSPRTVDVYRARLMKKYGAASTPDLVHRLLVS